MDRVEDLIEAARLQAVEVAELTRRESELEAERPLAKYSAVLRVAASGVQPLSGKAHSFSSAEELVESDPVYAEHLAARAALLAACQQGEEYIVIPGHETESGVEFPMLFLRDGFKPGDRVRVTRVGP